MAAGAGDVRGGELRPPGLVLHADGVAAQVDGLDQGGADAAHRVGDQVPGLAVAGDRGGGDRGQHLGGVGGGGGQVPAAALGPGVLLGGRPHRQRRGRVPCPGAGWRGRAGDRAGGGGQLIAGSSGLGEHEQVAVDAGADGRGAGGLVRAGGARGAGGELAAGDGGVQGDDVLGVDEPGGAGGGDDLARVIAQPGRAGGAGGDDGQDAAGPQHPLARRVQHAAAGAAAPGDGQGGLPRFRAAGLQQQARAAGPGLRQRARRRAEVLVQACAGRVAGGRAGEQPEDPAAGCGGRGQERPGPGGGDDDQLARPGERRDDMRGLRAGTRHRAGAAAPDADRHADPRASRPCRAADRRYPPGRTRRAVRALGPREVLGVTWAAGPAATADPLTLRKSGFRGLFSRPAAK